MVNKKYFRKDAKKFFLDMDGVIMDWDRSALNVLNLECNLDAIEKVKAGIGLEAQFPQVYNKVNDLGGEFWANIKPFPWAQELYDYLDSKGDLYILTSSGNFQKRGVNFLKGGISGKLDTLAKYFPNANPIFACSKYVCSTENSYLIDDTKGKMDDFKEFGGKGFLWPNGFVVEEKGFDTVFKELKEDVERFIL